MAVQIAVDMPTIEYSPLIIIVAVSIFGQEPHNLICRMVNVGVLYTVVGILVVVAQVILFTPQLTVLLDSLVLKQAVLVTVFTLSIRLMATGLITCTWLVCQ